MGVTAPTRAEVYGKYADQLVRFATGLVGADHAPDVVSEAMVHALWSDGWANVRNRRAYLYRAVLNEAHRHHRAVTRRRTVETRGAGLVHQEQQMPSVRPEVLEAVGRLTVSQRAVVFLAYWEDLRPADIARRLGLSDGTVHRQLGRAESRLRRILHE